MKPVLEIIGTISHFLLHAGLRGLGIANKSRDVDPAASVMKRMHYVTLTNCRCPVWAGRVAGIRQNISVPGDGRQAGCQAAPGVAIEQMAFVESEAQVHWLAF